MNDIRIFYTDIIQPGTLIRGIRVGFSLNREDKEIYIDRDHKLTNEEVIQAIQNGIDNNVKFEQWRG